MRNPTSHSSAAAKPVRHNSLISCHSLLHLSLGNPHKVQPLGTRAGEACRVPVCISPGVCTQLSQLSIERARRAFRLLSKAINNDNNFLFSFSASSPVFSLVVLLFLRTVEAFLFLSQYFLVSTYPNFAALLNHLPGPITQWRRHPISLY